MSTSLCEMDTKLSDAQLNALNSLMNGMPKPRVLPTRMPLRRELSLTPPVVIESLLMYEKSFMRRKELRPLTGIVSVPGKKLKPDEGMPPNEWVRVPGTLYVGPSPAAPTYQCDGFTCDMLCTDPWKLLYELPRDMSTDDVRRVAVHSDSGGASLDWERLVAQCPRVTTVVLGSYRLYEGQVKAIPTPYVGPLLRYLVISGSDYVALESVITNCAAFTQWLAFPDAFDHSTFPKNPTFVNVYAAVTSAVGNPENALNGVALWVQGDTATDFVIPESTAEVAWSKLQIRTTFGGMDTGCWVFGVRPACYPLWQGPHADAVLLDAAEAIHDIVEPRPDVGLTRRVVRMEMAVSS